MARGGKRPGAGRKPGSVTKRNRAIAEKWVDSGEVTPLEVMLKNMRFYDSEAERLLTDALKAASGGDVPKTFDTLKLMMSLRGEAQSAARDAAPFVHPRLSRVLIGGDDDSKPIRFTFAVGSARGSPADGDASEE